VSVIEDGDTALIGGFGSRAFRSAGSIRTRGR